MKKIRSELSQNPPQPRRFVSDAELEVITGIKQRTWQKHRLHGRGSKWYKLHGAVRYDLAEVFVWVDAHVAGGESVPRVEA
jgi:hypothetical protein